MRRYDRQPDAMLVSPVLQTFPILPPDLLAFRLYLIPNLELCVEKSGKNVGRQITGPKIQPRVFINLPSVEPTAICAFLTNDFSSFNVLRIINQ